MIKWDSISRGPTGHEAIAVLRVVERGVARAKWQHGETQSATLSRASATHEQAWTSLEEKRYQDAIPEAQSAKMLIENFSARK